MRWLTRPNLALQSLTTREPDREMIEVAITALQRVLAAEKVAAVQAEAAAPFEPAVGTAAPEAVPPAI